MPSTVEMQTVNMFQDALDGSSRRQEAIADNMANVNTPGYKRKEVSFKGQLKEAYMGEKPDVPLFKAHPKHIDLSTSAPIEPDVHRVTDTSMRHDKNNVDPDRQMAKMSKNSMYYQGLSQMLNKQFQTLNTLLTDLKQT